MSAGKKRLPPETFELPIQKIRRGYHSAVYFWREKQILEWTGYRKNILMQVFQKKRAVLCGIDEALAVLKLCSGRYRDQEKAFKLFDRFVETERLARQSYMNRHFSEWKVYLNETVQLEMELDALWENTFNELTVSALFDGDKIMPWETVMTIEGLPQHFSHLESVYLGILARSTLVASNVARVVEVANGKPVLFFADRFDRYNNQTSDGYAAMKAGAFGVATDSMGEWWGNTGVGTLPHALIACFMGDTAHATLAFARRYPQVNAISLVDFHNDCEKTAVEVADRFRAEGLVLWGVRLDTSENMVDQSIIRHGQMGKVKPTGVNPMLVRNVRSALDQKGHGDVKIVVSGGFNAEKISWFEKEGAPVDVYASGSSLLKGEGDFTADIVRVDGVLCGKVGRMYNPNVRLGRVA
ncbi:MAG TPA: quinolinate phosphoribosyl transferase [Candidatus Paceibacterota bacterium]